MKPPLKELILPLSLATNIVLGLFCFKQYYDPTPIVACEAPCEIHAVISADTEKY